MTATTSTYQFSGPGEGLDALRRVDVPVLEPGWGQVLVRVHALSINFRDLGLLKRRSSSTVVPLSDAAGEIVAVGPGVDTWSVGDRVIGAFFQGWIDGPFRGAHFLQMLGGLAPGVDGVLAEHVVLRADSIASPPSQYSWEEAATVPCSAVTAFNALFGEIPLRPGDTVLILGTGGVSLYALQFAARAGARVIATSSSDEKLETARALGAASTINYRTHPDWKAAVRDLSGGGVSRVVEVTGGLSEAVDVVSAGGHIDVVGSMFDTSQAPRGAVDSLRLIRRAVRLRGLMVGSTAMTTQTCRALEFSGIRPIIDTVIPFDQAHRAYERMLSTKHVGKIVINIE